MPALAEVLSTFRETALAKLVAIQEELWTRAPAEQQRLTVQLARNTFYFTLSCVVIRFFGDQLAV